MTFQGQIIYHSTRLDKRNTMLAKAILCLYLLSQKLLERNSTEFLDSLTTPQTNHDPISDKRVVTFDAKVAQTRQITQSGEKIIKSLMLRLNSVIELHPLQDLVYLPDCLSLQVSKDDVDVVSLRIFQREVADDSKRLVREARAQ